MSSVTLNSVTKRFGKLTAINDLSLDVNEGEFVVLLGPTGAGKTTTLRLVAGLEIPEMGAVKIGGQDVTNAPPAVRDVAFVFQQYSLYPHYSVYDNLAFPLRAPTQRWTEPDIKKRVFEIAEMLRITSKLTNRATELSGGEMQRVSIGRALVRSPKVFLMDEPLSSLDAKLREDLRLELKRIQRDLGATILYVTHDQLEAMTLADKVGVLSEGTLVQVGSPREIYEEPRNIYTAKRLGSPQINLLEARHTGLQNIPGGVDKIGVRPEDIEIGDHGAVSATVLVIEHLGVETVALLTTEGMKIHALIGDQTDIREGDTTKFTVRDGAAMYFNREGERFEQGVPQ